MRRYLKKVSQILIGFFIIYGIFLLGEGIQKFVKIPIPGNVIGFIIMFVALKMKILKESIIKDASEFLIGYLVLFFIPYLVKVVTYKELIQKELLPIILSIFGSYVFLLFVSSKLFEYLAKRKER